MTHTTPEPLELEQDDDGAIDRLIRWAGGERDAIRKLLAELVDARAENADLKAARG